MINFKYFHMNKNEKEKEKDKLKLYAGRQNCKNEN